MYFRFFFDINVNHSINNNQKNTKLAFSVSFTLQFDIVVLTRHNYIFVKVSKKEHLLSLQSIKRILVIQKNPSNTNESYQSLKSSEQNGLDPSCFFTICHSSTALILI